MKTNSREYSDDTPTIRKHSQPFVFPIFYQNQLIMQATLKAEATVSQLLETVKSKLTKRFDNIIGLCTRDGNQILDYTLQIKNYPIFNYRNQQSFNILLQEIVADYSMPTLADFTFEKCIGEGVSACVYLVRHNSNGRLYALKQMKKEYFQDFKRLEQALREKKIMTDLIADLPFVTKLISSFESCKHLNLLLQFYPGGELFFHLQQRKFTEEEAKIIFAEILVTFQALHARKIIYRDLKPQNIMVDFDGHMRLGDFGLCKINLEKYDLTNSYCGSPQYMAPQLKYSQGYSYSADFYTMGALIYELITGQPPYYQNQPLIFDKVTEDFIQIVTRLIQEDIKLRVCNFNEIKKMKWLKKIDWEKVIKKQYKLPIKINPYLNYTHDQFKQKIIDNYQLKEEQKYDKLFDTYFYLSDSKLGIAQFYPQFKHHYSKLQKSLKSIKSQRSQKSNHSRNNKKSQSKSKDYNKFNNSKNKFDLHERYTTKPHNIYTQTCFRTNDHDKPKNSSRSKSKKNQPIFATQLPRSKSPPSLKFNKLNSVKSAKTFASTYLKTLEQHFGQTKH